MNKEDYYHAIKNLTLMDDDFFNVCLNDNIKAIQLILNIILNRDDLQVKSVKTQYNLPQVNNRSVRLDIYAVDSSDKEYDIEIQRANDGAIPQRARYNSASLDARMLEPGYKCKEVRESYVIFITENDILKGGEPVYSIERTYEVEGNQVLFGDGSHIIYINGAYKGDSKIGRLLHDLRCPDPARMYYKELSDTITFYKENEKGVQIMCNVMQLLKEEGIREGRRVGKQEGALENAKRSAINMLNKGLFTDEAILECVSGLTEEILEQAKQELFHDPNE